MKPLLKLFPALFIILLTGFSAKAQYTLTDLGTLGGTVTRGLGINASGEVVGDSVLANPDPQHLVTKQHAFLYHNGVMTDLGALPGSDYSSAQAINVSGQAVGYSFDSGDHVQRAVLWSNGTIADLGTLGGDSAFAQGINASGQITGLAALPNFIRHAFLYSNGVMHDLGTLPNGTSGSSTGWSINDAGQIAGTSVFDTLGNDHAVIFSGGTITDLGTLGSSNSSATTINAAGHVTGFSYLMDGGGPFHAFLYKNGSMTDLGSLGGNSQGYGINASDQVVGYDDSTGSLHAFLYTPGKGIIDLNTVIPSGSGLTLQFAFAINDAGQITGFATSANGDYHGFLLSPPQETPFATFSAQLIIQHRRGSFAVDGKFALASGSNPIDLTKDTVTLDIGNYSLVIPPNSFTFYLHSYVFAGNINGVPVAVRIAPVANSTTNYTFQAVGTKAPGLPSTNPVTLELTIGKNTGTTNVAAEFE